MKECIVKSVQTESPTALAAVSRVAEQASVLHPAYIGLDVHKATLAVAIAECGREQPEY